MLLEERVPLELFWVLQCPTVGFQQLLHISELIHPLVYLLYHVSLGVDPVVDVLPPSFNDPPELVHLVHFPLPLHLVPLVELIPDPVVVLLQFQRELRGEPREVRHEVILCVEVGDWSHQVIDHFLDLLGVLVHCGHPRLVAVSLGSHLLYALEDRLYQFLVNIGGVFHHITLESLVVLFQGPCEDLLPLLLDDGEEGGLQGVLVLLQDLVDAPLELLTGALQNQVVSALPPSQLLVLFDVLLDVLFQLLYAFLVIIQEVRVELVNPHQTSPVA